MTRSARFVFTLNQTSGDFGAFMTQLAIIAALLSVVAGLACGSDDEIADAGALADAALASEVTVLDTFDVSGFNGALVEGQLTADVAIYITENGPIEWQQRGCSIERAQRIFGEGGAVAN